VSPLDGVNGVRRNLLACIGLSVGCRVSGAGGRSGSAAPSFQPITRLWQFEGPVKHGPLFDPCPPKASVKPAGAKSEEESVLKCKGLRGLRVGVNSHAKSA
jgi:hypothetical protein